MNGVPLRRIAQSYVIATKTRVDISGINLPDTLNDDFFRRTDPDMKDGTADIFTDSKQVCVCMYVCMCVCVFQQFAAG